jgi:hypothetical protein
MLIVQIKRCCHQQEATLHNANTHVTTVYIYVEHREQNIAAAPHSRGHCTGFISVSKIRRNTMGESKVCTIKLLTRVVPKVSVLIFHLNVYWTFLKLQVISFKVWPLRSYTVVPTFFPLIIAVPEVIFGKCVLSSRLLSKNLKIKYIEL